MPQILAVAIDWPFAILTGAALLLALTWPAHRRLARRANLATAMGDGAAALDAAMRMRRSWLPAAVLERLTLRGRQDATIARCHLSLGEPEAALPWAQRGLAVARSPHVRALLHMLAAQAHAELREHAHMDDHLTELYRIEQRARPPLGNPAWITALSVNACSGRLSAAERILSGLPAVSATPSGGVWAILMTLRALGRFDEILPLALPLIQEEEAAAGNEPTRSADPDGLGIADVRRAVTAMQKAGIILAAADAAAASARWELVERLLDAAILAQIARPLLLMDLLGVRARLAGHRGDRASLLRCLSEMDELAARHPRDHHLQIARGGHAMHAWQAAGEPERALAAAPFESLNRTFPLIASEILAMAADSLEALGSTEEAQTHRREALELAPGAYWNRAGQGEVESASAAPSEATFTPRSVVQAADAAGSGPVEPAASAVACAAWIVAVLAMAPVVGVPAGIALVVLSIVLMAKRQPLPHDRRVGRAGLIVAAVSLGFAVVSVPSCASAMMRGFAQVRGAPEFDRADHDGYSGASEWNGEAPSESQAPAPAASSPSRDRRQSDLPAPWQQTALYLIVLGVSIVLHEIGHAVAAFWSGDPTARDRGRFSLNPVRHFSLMGSLIVPAALTLLHSDAVIGWAKPVPVRPDRFRHPRRGQLGVSLAGVSLNLLIALVATNLLVVTMLALRWVYAGAAFFELMYPFRSVGVAGVPHESVWSVVLSLGKAAVWINVLLLSFNLLPLPPLDGFGVIRALAPRPLIGTVNRLSGIGTMVLLALVAFKALGYLLLPGALLGIALLGYAQWVGGA